MYSIPDIFDNTFADYRAAYFFNKHFQPDEAMQYGLIEDAPRNKDYRMLQTYLRTTQSLRDEEVYLDVIDKIYQWCLQNLPNLRMFYDQKVFSISFLEEDKVYLTFLDYYESNISTATTFLKTEWEKGVDEFLLNFIQVLCYKQWTNMSYAADAYRITRDYVEGKSNFEEDLELLLLPDHNAPNHDYHESIIKTIHDPLKKPEGPYESDPLYRVYVSTIQTLLYDTAPFVGNVFSGGRLCKAQFNLKISIPTLSVLTVSLSRDRFDFTTITQSITLHLDAPDYMSNWRSFFSTWRMETLRTTKTEYLAALQEHDRLSMIHYNMGVNGS